MKTQLSLCGLILAGGRSSRMGHDKASLIHPDGRTLLRRTCDLLQEAGCDSIAISLRHNQDIPLGFEDCEIVSDPEGTTQGPMTGMITSMQRHPDNSWLVLACDLPRLDLATLKHLITSIKNGEKFLAYRSEFDALPEPLCALYSSDSLPILEQAQADQFYCPRKILIRNDCRLLDPITPRALENANTPQDWQSAITS